MKGKGVLRALALLVIWGVFVAAGSVRANEQSADFADVQSPAQAVDLGRTHLKRGGSAQPLREAADLASNQGKDRIAIGFLVALAEEAAAQSADLQRIAYLQQKTGNQDGAIAYLRRAIALDPTDITPRWSLAMATHWSPRWSIARKQYTEILEIDPDHADAKKYLKLLVISRGHEVRIKGTASIDSLGVLRSELTTAGDVYATDFLRLRLKAGPVAYGQFNDQGEIEDRLAGAKGVGEIVLPLPLNSNLHLRFGGLLLEEGQAFPIAKVELTTVIAWKAYLGVHVSHQPFDLQLVTLRGKMTATRFGVTGYFEPFAHVNGSLAFYQDVLSDGNLRSQVWGGAWFEPGWTFLRARLGPVIAGDHMWQDPPGAVQYWRPEWLGAASFDVGAVGRIAECVEYSAKVAPVITTGLILGWNANAALGFTQCSQFDAKVSYDRIDLGGYVANAFNATVGFRF